MLYSSEKPPSKYNYAWVIVIVGTLMMAASYGLMYSFSVFFKPMAEYFNWDRATMSAVYSTSIVSRGALSIGAGWLADRFGARKIMIIAGILLALGFLLSSQVKDLWQFFITYALIVSSGLSGTFGIVTAVTSRWFMKRRGLALGIVSSGVGLGTLLIVPGAERLIAIFDWSTAFIICGAVSGIVMVGSALFLRQAPVSTPAAGVSSQSSSSPAPEPQGSGLGAALRSSNLFLLLFAFLLFFLCTQMVMVHLVNYATDLGISPLVAATLISLIGVVSIAGRMIVGVSADRLGVNNTLILTHVFLLVAYVCLIFSGPLWSFYAFAVICGLTYGGEGPQIPLFIGKYFGTKSMATLMGLTLFVGNIGGALGPWVAGSIFDATRSYHWAFVFGACAGLFSMVLAIILKRKDRTNPAAYS